MKQKVLNRFFELANNCYKKASRKHDNIKILILHYQIDQFQKKLNLNLKYQVKNQERVVSKSISFEF